MPLDLKGMEVQAWSIEQESNVLIETITGNVIEQDHSIFVFINKKTTKSKYKNSEQT